MQSLHWHSWLIFVLHKGIATYDSYALELLWAHRSVAHM